MLNNNLIEFAKTISFTAKNDSAYGFLNGFFVSIYDAATKKNFYIYYNLKQENKINSKSPVSIMTVSGKLSDVFSKYDITDYSVKENGIRVSCILSYKDFYSLMKDVSLELDKIKALRKNICSECGEEIDVGSKKYRISTNGINMLLCSECASYLQNGENNSDSAESEDSSKEDNEVSEEGHTDIEENITDSKEDIEENTNDIKEDIEKNSKSKTDNKDTKEISDSEDSSENKNIKDGSVIKGIFGSILFGLGVSICFVLLYIFAVPTNVESSFKSGYYVNWISAFTAVSAFFGYKIFSKKEISVNGILISGGISLVLVAISQYIASIALFARERFFIYDEATWDRFYKAIPFLSKIPFKDVNASADFKIYIMMDIIFVIVALLIISFFTAPKTEDKIIIEEI